MTYFPSKMGAALAVASVATRYKAEFFLILDEMSAKSNVRCARCRKRCDTAQSRENFDPG
jgi:hypothetical protein